MMFVYVSKKMVFVMADYAAVHFDALLYRKHRYKLGDARNKIETQRGPPAAVGSSDASGLS